MHAGTCLDTEIAKLQALRCDHAFDVQSRSWPWLQLLLVVSEAVDSCVSAVYHIDDETDAAPFS